MCGISGLLSTTGTGDGDRDTIADLNQSQRHRGPDDAGLWSHGHSVLGQTRLAIVDLSEGGHQPFASPDGSIVAVFNGEIYNHNELRRRYQLSVPERCDGAILPALWQLLGPDMFAELRGMFAIAVCDTRTGTTFIARDPFGIKPLYFVRPTDGKLLFASEPRPLARSLRRPRLDRSALRHYLTFGSLGRDQSPFTDIESVPANGWVRWDRDLRRTAGWVRPDLFDDLPDTPPASLREAFLESVSHHLLGDVPIALLLSSGLDSAAIAWAAATLGTSLTCVTVDTGVGMGEGEQAREIATGFGHRHELVSIIPDTDLVEHYFAAMQRPSIDGLNTLMVSKAIAELGIKVALSGIGGDELLSGYRHFRMLRYLALLRAADPTRLPRLAARLCGDRRQKLARLLVDDATRDAYSLAVLIRRLHFDEQVDRLLPGWSPTAQPDEPPVPGINPRRGDRSALALSINEIEGYLGGTLLPDCDAYSMAWSVEIRVPFVDVPFARAALGTAPRRGLGKRRFAAMTGDATLDRIVRVPKRGFSLPMDQWMRDGPLAGTVHRALEPDAPVTEVLRADRVADMFADWRSGRLGWSRAWSVACLDAWLRALDADLSGLEPVPTTSGADHG